jgi:hypothetical protein
VVPVSLVNHAHPRACFTRRSPRAGFPSARSRANIGVVKGDDILQKLLRELADLPAEERTERLMTFFDCMLRVMEPEQIGKVRAAIANLPLKGRDASHDQILETIDGHLALRELGFIQRRRKRK